MRLIDADALIAEYDRVHVGKPGGARKLMENAPTIEPEIIRCKDCKYSDENGRRVSVRWLPCMDVRTGSNWFCGSAERREE